MDVTDEHPTHLLFKDGAETRIPLTTEEIEARAKRAAENAARTAAAGAERDADLKAVAERAAQDPAFASLARLARIALPMPGAAS